MSGKCKQYMESYCSSIAGKGNKKWNAEITGAVPNDMECRPKPWKKKLKII